MKLSLINILLIFMAFHAVLINGKYIDISKGYELIDLPKGETKVSFTVSSSSSLDKSPFIFIKVSKDIEYSIRIYDYSSDYQIFPSQEWLYIELQYLDKTQRETIYFTFRNNNTEPVQFIFIDTSKAIDIDLKTFLNWKYNITFESTNQPIPILFKINNIQKETTIYFNMTAEGEIVQYEYLLYYCLNENRKCNFKEVKNSLTLMKGKNYKIKLHPIKLEREDKYYYQPIQYNKINEINNEDDDEDNDKYNEEEDDDDDFPLIYIILISVGGLLFVIVLIFIIIRCSKKRQDINFNQKTEEISQQQLLN